jgi:hypothetical protein
MIGKLFEYLISGLSSGSGLDASFWDSVKLVHADDLRGWERFKEYQDHESATTFGEYRKEARRLGYLREEMRQVLETIARVDAVDHDDLEKYETVQISVPRSLMKRTVVLAVPESKHFGTVSNCSEGTLVNGKLTVAAGWRRKVVYLSMSCPSRVLFKDEIASKRQWLDALSIDEKKKVDEIQNSRFSQPVLFISHRWESVDCPDPEGEQLKRLRSLRDCFVVYDYSSFPQKPTADEDKAALQLILQHMGLLLENVIVLASPDYADRGWCLYEYMISTLKHTLLCDEVGDPNLIALRNWSSMRAPPPPAESYIRGHSIESSVQNGINQAILDTVNKVLPLYRNSRFTVSTDRELVTDLLTSQLAAMLPPKKEYLEYVGEWKDIPWTPDDLSKAFLDEPGWERLHTAKFDPYQLDLPKTLEEAVERRYEIPKPRPISPMEAVFMSMGVR